MRKPSENELSFLIRKCIFNVYNRFGPGSLESVYVTFLVHELIKADLNVKTQVAVPVEFDNIKLEIGFRLDILVEDLVIIEVKAVETLHEKHHMQLVTYLRLTGKRLGLLVNFYTEDITKSILRKINDRTGNLRLEENQIR